VCVCVCVVIDMELLQYLEKVSTDLFHWQCVTNLV